MACETAKKETVTWLQQKLVQVADAYATSASSDSQDPAVVENCSTTWIFTEVRPYLHYDPYYADLLMRNSTVLALNSGRR